MSRCDKKKTPNSMWSSDFCYCCCCCCPCIDLCFTVLDSQCKMAWKMYGQLRLPKMIGVGSGNRMKTCIQSPIHLYDEVLTFFPFSLLQTLFSMPLTDHSPVFMQNHLTLIEFWFRCSIDVVPALKRLCWCWCCNQPPAGVVYNSKYVKSDHNSFVLMFLDHDLDRGPRKHFETQNFDYEKLKGLENGIQKVFNRK